jgi:hypothetical protein
VYLLQRDKMASSNNIIHMILALLVLNSWIGIGESAPSKFMIMVHRSNRSILFLATKSATLNPRDVNATNPGFISGSCPVAPNNYEYGWHFELPDLTFSFISIRVVFEKAGIVTTMIQEPCGAHAYVYTPTGDRLVSASANVTGSSSVFVLSDVCSPPSKLNRSSCGVSFRS